MERVRLFRCLLGEREREVSEGVKDLVRSSPRPGLLRLLSLPDPRCTGGRDLLREYRPPLLRLGGVTERAGIGETDRTLDGERRLLSSDRRPSRLLGIYVSISRLGGGPLKSFLSGEPRRLRGGDLESLGGRRSKSEPPLPPRPRPRPRSPRSR